MLTHTDSPRSGAQYVHYAFGLLERTNVFCPVQAVLDNAHVGLVKRTLKEAEVDAGSRDAVVNMIREVMESTHKTFMYHVPLPTQDDVYFSYPFESEQGALKGACDRFQEIEERPRKQIPADVQQTLKDEIPGILPETLA